jgi:hypothetical protein
MAPSDSSEIPAAMRTLGDKGPWPDNVKMLYTLMLSRCSSSSNHGFPVLSWMARACPEKVAANTAMTDHELVEWNDPKVKPEGKAAIQKANEMLYTTMSLMTDDTSEGGLAKNLAVDTGDIAIGDGLKLLKKFHELFKQDASSMEDAEDLCEEVTNFKAIKNETAQVLVARFNALTTKLVGKSSTMKLPDIFLQTRFIRALTTTGVRNYTNVLDRHHRGEFKDLATLQKAVIDEEVVLLKKAHFQSTNSSVAAAASTTDANLAPGRTKAEKRKAKKARKRAKALAATGESTSTDSAACTTDGTMDTHAKPPTGTGAGSRGMPANKTCYSCGEVGHIAPHCPHSGAATRNTTEKVWCSFHNKHGYHLEADCSLNPASPKGKGKGKGGKGDKGKGGKGKYGYGRGGYGGYPAAYNSQFHSYGSYGRGKGDKGKHGGANAHAAVHQPYDAWSNAPTHEDGSLYELQQGSSSDYNY